MTDKPSNPPMFVFTRGRSPVNRMEPVTGAIITREGVDSTIKTDITLRDMFAGMAMLGQAESPLFTRSSFSLIAEESYAMADTMLAERDKS